MNVRPRRLRKSQAVRNLVCETRLSASMLVYPIFVREGFNIEEDIAAMPGQKRYSPDTLPKILERISESGVKSVMLFGLPEVKDEMGSGAFAENGVVQQALRVAKAKFPELVLMSDVCMCEYTSHGHCGCIKDGDVDNDATLALLAKTAVSQARAGADVVAPSDMMDGHVAAIRAALDNEGFIDTIIFSYAVKYSSAFYGPFREAAQSAPAFGDRKTYQMSPPNIREAIKEAQIDVLEGADMIMVKPGLPYLDVVRAVKESCNVPVGVYSVSGEYSMIKAAAANGWINEQAAMLETANCLARAGADILVTYFAPELAELIRG